MDFDPMADQELVRYYTLITGGVSSVSPGGPAAEPVGV